MQVLYVLFRVKHSEFHLYMSFTGKHKFGSVLVARNETKHDQPGTETFALQYCQNLSIAKSSQSIQSYQLPLLTVGPESLEVARWAFGKHNTGRGPTRLRESQSAVSGVVEISLSTLLGFAHDVSIPRLKGRIPA